MEFYDFFDFRNYGWEKKIFHDFRNSVIEVYEFHGFRDSGMEYFNSYYSGMEF